MAIERLPHQARAQRDLRRPERRYTREWHAGDGGGARAPTVLRDL